MNDWMVGRVCLALLVCVSLAGCDWTGQGAGTARTTPENSAFVGLSAAPLKLPRLGPGQSCPLSKPSQIDAQLGTSSGSTLIGTALGSSPVYLTNGEFVRSDPSHPQKVAWIADPSYSGPIMIRGGRIDGTGQMLFGSHRYGRGAPVKRVEGSDLYLELFLETDVTASPASRWRGWPSFTYIATPGCYAWQVDGLGFTEFITIQALQLPMLLPGIDPCPVSPQQVAHSLSAQFGYGPALGTGPIYALMGEMQEGVLKYSQSYSQLHYKDGWAYSKVLWLAKPGITGDVLIRGREIDGPNAIGFEMGDDAPFALHWAVASAGGWASTDSETRIRAPGCYAYQVDSQEGSEVIVFQAVAIP